MRHCCAGLHAISGEDRALRVQAGLGEEPAPMRLPGPMRVQDGASGLQVRRDNSPLKYVRAFVAGARVSRGFAPAMKATRLV
jgi:hypothetical protein